jgi:hypothetical protein
VARVAQRSTNVFAHPRRFALYVTRYLDCNPLRSTPASCYNPLATVLTDLWNRFRYRAVARPYGVIHVDPRAIKWNLRVPPRKWPIGSIFGGNWDRALRRPVEIAWKISSMRQRFHEGLEWKETDLFRNFYGPQFKRPGARVKGVDSLEALSAHYERVYDRLYETIRAEGFRTPTLTHPEASFAYVHIDRNGGFMYTLEGNHRLGMALALDLATMPVRVVTRHRTWQLVREETKAASRASSPHFGHPDLLDLSTCDS